MPILYHSSTPLIPIYISASTWRLSPLKRSLYAYSLLWDNMQGIAYCSLRILRYIIASAAYRSLVYSQNINFGMSLLVLHYVVNCSACCFSIHGRVSTEFNGSPVLQSEPNQKYKAIAIIRPQQRLTGSPSQKSYKRYWLVIIYFWWR